MLNIVLFGPPGAGKGTQAEYLKVQFNLEHLSTGDLLRSEIGAETDLGIKAKSYIDKGELVPDQLVIDMIRKKLLESKQVMGFIFDGFPRTVEQAVALDQLLNENNTPVSGMLALEVEKQELINRLLERGKTSGRSDDSDVSIIENRIAVYNEKTAPVMNYYNQQGKYRAVSGMGSIEVITERLNKEIDSIS